MSVLLNDTPTLLFGANPGFADTLAFTSSGKQVTLTNLIARAITVSSLTATGDFSVVSHDCASLAASGTCTIALNFRPTGPGTRTGSLIVNSDAPGSPYSLSLSGNALDVALSLSRTKRSARTAASATSMSISASLLLSGIIGLSNPWTGSWALTCDAPGRQLPSISGHAPARLPQP